MARVAITNIAEPNVGSVRKKDFSTTDIEFNQRFTNVQDLTYVPRSINAIGFGILKSKFEDRQVKAEEILPFRVRFTSVDIPGYGRENPPPIGIAIIGTNNYIL